MCGAQGRRNNTGTTTLTTTTTTSPLDELDHKSQTAQLHDKETPRNAQQEPLKSSGTPPEGAISEIPRRLPPDIPHSFPGVAVWQQTRFPRTSSCSCANEQSAFCCGLMAPSPLNSGCFKYCAAIEAALRSVLLKLHFSFNTFKTQRSVSLNDGGFNRIKPRSFFVEN